MSSKRRRGQAMAWRQPSEEGHGRPQAGGGTQRADAGLGAQPAPGIRAAPGQDPGLQSGKYGHKQQEHIVLLERKQAAAT